MAETTPFAERLKQGILRIDQQPAGGTDAEAMGPFKRSLERTLARLNSPQSSAIAKFRFQLTGGKPLLFQGTEALPVEPARLPQLLNSVGVTLQPGETLDLDGGLAAWLIRPEVNITDTKVRSAESAIKTIGTGRDRDHAAAQSAESTKVRLRSRLTQLVSALQAAQKEAEMPPPPPPPPAAPETPPTPAEAPPPAVLAKAMRKVLAAIEGSGFKAAAIGDVAHQAWGSKQAPMKVELLMSSSEAQRETVLGAARGEGLQQAPGGGPLNLRFIDAKLNATGFVDLIEAATPFQKQILTRAQPGNVLQESARLATCEDLILLRAGSTAPGDRDKVIELLRLTAGRIDGAYLKKEAEAAGVFDQLKSAWQQAKQQG